MFLGLLLHREQRPWPPAASVPDRGEVSGIDHTPQAGLEMKNHHPFLILSTAPFHASVGLVVDLGPIPERPEAHSFVLCHQIKSFDWKARAARPHPMGSLNNDRLDQVLEIVGQILGFVV